MKTDKNRPFYRKQIHGFLPCLLKSPKSPKWMKLQTVWYRNVIKIHDFKCFFSNLQRKKLILRKHGIHHNYDNRLLGLAFVGDNNDDYEWLSGGWRRVDHRQPRRPHAPIQNRSQWEYLWVAAGRDHLLYKPHDRSVLLRPSDLKKNPSFYDVLIDQWTLDAIK